MNLPEIHSEGSVYSFHFEAVLVDYAVGTLDRDAGPTLCFPEEGSFVNAFQHDGVIIRRKRDHGETDYYFADTFWYRAHGQGATIEYIKAL